MERLSPQDATFLYVENDLNHMAIAVVAKFEGPAPGQDEIEAMVASKLDLVPRYRQRIRFVPLDLGRPVWCDDPHFNLRYHVRHSALASPGSDEQLQTLVGRLMSQQLDRDKPLWELWAIEGLDDRGWAMVLKLHHCMVDGMAAVDLLSVLLDESPSHEYAEPREWTPEPEPSAGALVRDAVLGQIERPFEALQDLGAAWRAPGGVIERARDFAQGLGTYTRFANLAVESSLNGSIGPHRNWRWATTTLADVKRIRQRHGGTVNDVVLSVITRGFRSLLESRGEPVDGLVVRTLVPVSVRGEDEHGTFDNRVSAMFAELPVGIADPVERLTSISRQMNDLKEHHQSAAGETLTALSGLAPPALLALGTRLFAEIDQWAVQTVTTNVPGPQSPYYASGRRMTSAYLYVPIAGSVRIGVVIFSYDGALTFAVTGDYDTAPDTSVLCRSIEAGIEELLQA